jgi:hypothetical protein
LCLGGARTQLGYPAWQAHAPRTVALVAADLAGDVRDCEGGELVAAFEIEAVDRIDQADAPDLVQIVVFVRRARVTADERFDQRQVELDESLASLAVAVLVIRPQESCGLRTAFALVVPGFREASFPLILAVSPGAATDIAEFLH